MYLNLSLHEIRQVKFRKPGDREQTNKDVRFFLLAATIAILMSRTSSPTWDVQAVSLANQALQALTVQDFRFHSALRTKKAGTPH